jgi:predicted transglutaminase-like cysteine proteinase
VFSLKALTQRIIVLGVSAAAAACTSLPPASSSMPLGMAAAPPMGFVQFCERQPGDCDNVDAAELGHMRVAAAAAQQSRTAVAAISYDWSSAFAQQRAQEAQASPTHRAGEATLASFDWTKVFPQARSAVLASGPAPQANRPAAPAVALMNARTWSLLEKTNSTVNMAIVPRDDVAIYGVSDYWTTPLESGVKYGDCEDYVLEKRHRLVAAGLPASALSIAVVLTDKGESHAVLVVATSTGDYVLDNRTPWILPWTQAAYRWREREVAGSAAHWSFPSVAAPGPHAAPARFLLASAR